MVVGHSSGQLENPKYISVHLPIKSDFVMLLLWEEKNLKSDIAFGVSNKNKPFISNSSLDNVLGVVSLLINRLNTVAIKTKIIIKFLFTAFIKLGNDRIAKL
jgi:hypothetical protein